MVGLMNVQFAIKDGEIYLIEVNPRASRTVPFVAKATDSAIASIAARVMAGEKLSAFPQTPTLSAGRRLRHHTLPLADPMTLADPMMPWFSVKEAVLPFAPLPRRRHHSGAGDALHRRGDGVGPRLPPRLPQGADGRRHVAAAIGPRLCLDQGRRQDRADAGGREKRWSSWAFPSWRPAARRAGWPATTCPCDVVNKVYEGRPNIVDIMKDGEIQLVMNTTEGSQAVEDSKDIRSVALYDKIPYSSPPPPHPHAAALAIKAQAEGDVGVKSLQG